MCRETMIETILTNAANELEEIRQAEQSIITNDGSHDSSMTQTPNSSPLSSSVHLNTRFPSNCLKLLYSIPGNLRCVDCDATNPQWATLTFGALICIDCSGRHRQMGVQVSVVRSITMDSWKHSHILAMLEGGNKQLADFFERHGLSSPIVNTTPSNNAKESKMNFNNTNSISSSNRYKTNAAKFYKTNLSHHVMKVIESGLYKGRDTFRKSPQKKKRRYLQGGTKGVVQNCSNECQSSLRVSQAESKNGVGTNA